MQCSSEHWGKETRGQGFLSQLEALLLHGSTNDSRVAQSHQPYRSNVQQRAWHSQAGHYVAPNWYHTAHHLPRKDIMGNRYGGGSVFSDMYGVEYSNGIVSNKQPYVDGTFRRLYNEPNNVANQNVLFESNVTSESHGVVHGTDTSYWRKDCAYDCITSHQSNYFQPSRNQLGNSVNQSAQFLHRAAEKEIRTSTLENRERHYNESDVMPPRHAHSRAIPALMSYLNKTSVSVSQNSSQCVPEPNQHTSHNNRSSSLQTNQNVVWPTRACTGATLNSEHEQQNRLAFQECFNINPPLLTRSPLSAVGQGSCLGTQAKRSASSHKTLPYHFSHAEASVSRNSMISKLRGMKLPVRISNTKTDSFSSATQTGVQEIYCHSSSQPSHLAPQGHHTSTPLGLQYHQHHSGQQDQPSNSAVREHQSSIFAPQRHQLSTSVVQDHHLSNSSNQQCQPSTSVAQDHQSSVSGQWHQPSTLAVQQHNQSHLFNQQCQSSNSVVQGHQSSNSVVQGHQSSNSVVQGHQSSNSVVQGHQSSNSVVQGHQSSNSVVQGHQSSISVVQGHQSSNSVVQGHQSSNSAPQHLPSTRVVQQHHQSNSSNQQSQPVNLSVQCHQSPNSTQLHQLSNTSNEQHTTRTEVPQSEIHQWDSLQSELSLLVQMLSKSAPYNQLTESPNPQVDPHLSNSETGQQQLGNQTSQTTCISDPQNLVTLENIVNSLLDNNLQSKVCNAPSTAELAIKSPEIKVDTDLHFEPLFVSEDLKPNDLTPTVSSESSGTVCGTSIFSPKVTEIFGNINDNLKFLLLNMEDEQPEVTNSMDSSTHVPSVISQEYTSIPDENIAISKDIIGTSNENIGTSHENISTSNENISSSNENMCTSNKNICISNENISSSNENICISNENTSTPNENICISNENISTLNENICISNENISTSNENTSIISDVINEEENVTELSSLSSSENATLDVKEEKYSILSAKFFKCSLCENVSFPTELTFFGHLVRHHENCNKMDCHYCGQTVNKLCIIPHMKAAHHRAYKGMYTCGGQVKGWCCTYTTTVLHPDLEWHLLHNHTGESKFVCPLCGFGSASTAEYLDHFKKKKHVSYLSSLAIDVDLQADSSDISCHISFEPALKETTGESSFEKINQLPTLKKGIGESAFKKTIVIGEFALEQTAGNNRSGLPCSFSFTPDVTKSNKPTQARQAEKQLDTDKWIRAREMKRKKSIQSREKERDKAIMERKTETDKSTQAGQMEKNKSVVEKDKFVVEKNKSVVEKNKSVVEKNKSVVEKDKSVVEKNKSVVEKNKSVVEKNKSVVEKDKSVVEKNKSVVEKDQSVVEKNKSVVEKDKSVVEKDKSVVEKDKSVVEKDKSVEAENKVYKCIDRNQTETNKSVQAKHRSCVEVKVVPSTDKYVQKIVIQVDPTIPDTSEQLIDITECSSPDKSLNIPPDRKGDHSTRRPACPQPSSNTAQVKRQDASARARSDLEFELSGRMSQFSDSSPDMKGRKHSLMSISEECFYTTKLAESFRQSVLLRNESRKFTSKRKQRLENHTSRKKQRKDDDTGKRITCYYCDETFSSLHAVLSHSKYEHRSKILSERQPISVRHYESKKKKDDTSRTFACYYCNQAFSALLAVIAHCKYEHKHDQILWIYRSSMLTFTAKGKLVEGDHKKMSRRKYLCSGCSFKSKKMSHVEKHIKTEHRLRTKWGTAYVVRLSHSTERDTSNTTSNTGATDKTVGHNSSCGVKSGAQRVQLIVKPPLKKPGTIIEPLQKKIRKPMKDNSEKVAKSLQDKPDNILKHVDYKPKKTCSSRPKKSRLGDTTTDDEAGKSDAHSPHEDRIGNKATDSLRATSSSKEFPLNGDGHKRSCSDGAEESGSDVTSSVCFAEKEVERSDDQSHHEDRLGITAAKKPKRISSSQCILLNQKAKESEKFNCSMQCQTNAEQGVLVAINSPQHFLFSGETEELAAVKSAHHALAQSETEITESESFLQYFSANDKNDESRAGNSFELFHTDINHNEESKANNYPTFTDVENEESRAEKLHEKILLTVKDMNYRNRSSNLGMDDCPPHFLEDSGLVEIETIYSPEINLSNTGAENLVDTFVQHIMLANEEQQTNYLDQDIHTNSKECIDEMDFDNFWGEIQHTDRQKTAEEQNGMREETGMEISLDEMSSDIKNQEEHHSSLTYTCHECDYKVSSLFHFRLHIAQHCTDSEKLVPAVFERSNLRCGICGYFATDQNDFEQHEDYHIKEKRFICGYCNVDSDTTDQIQKHIIRSHQLPVLFFDRNLVYSKMFQEPQKLIKLNPTVVLEMIEFHGQEEQDMSSSSEHASNVNSKDVRDDVLAKTHSISSKECSTLVAKGKRDEPKLVDRTNMKETSYKQKQLEVDELTMWCSRKVSRQTSAEKISESNTARRNF